jgi:hypothetical protein
MNVKVYKNFLSNDECQMLNNIALANTNNWFGFGLSHNVFIDTRLTTRLYMENKTYTQEVLDVSKKVRAFVGVDKFPLIYDHGSNGVVVSITYQNGDVPIHQDPKSAKGLPAYRCNILTQTNEDGAELYVDGKKINVEAGDLHCYMASELPHFVTTAKGKTPRIMYMFGAYIPKEYWCEYEFKETELA